MANRGTTNGGTTNGPVGGVIDLGPADWEPAERLDIPVAKAGDDMFFAVIGAIDIPVEFQVANGFGNISIPVEFEVTEVFTVIEPDGAIDIPVKFDVAVFDDDIDVPVEFDVFDGSYYFDFANNNAFRWCAIVNLEVVGGDVAGESGDITEFLTGSLSVEAEESTARIAEFTRDPRPKGPCPVETDPVFLDLQKHIGRDVTIDYQLQQPDGTILTTQRIFTGIVDGVEYDPKTRTTAYTCTDNRQSLLENMDRSAIDALMPGSYYSDFVFDPEGDNLEYAEDRASTLPRALDLDRFGNWRWTAWAAQISPTWKYDSGNVIYESLGIEIEDYRNILTEYEIDCNYTYTRLRERLSTWNWDYPGGGFCDYLNSGHTLPRKDNIVQACNGGAWRCYSVTFQNLPPSTTFSCSGGPQVWVNWGDRNAPLFCEGASGTLAKRFSNKVVENYAIVIQAPEAQAGFGTVKDKTSVDVEPDFDDLGWTREGLAVEEAYIERNPNVSSTTQTAGDDQGFSVGQVFEYPFQTNGTDRYYDAIDADAILEGEGRRDDFNTAIETIIQVGKTAILAAHRQNNVFWTTPLMPEMELFHTVEVETCEVHARGKVRSIRHEMDLFSGSATSTIEIAVSKTQDGAVTETPTAPPPIPDTVSGMGTGINIGSVGTRYGGQNSNPLFTYSHSPDPSPEINDEPFNGYTGNRDPADVNSNVYQIRFEIITEEIDAADAEDIEATQPATYDVNIPDELLNLQA